MQLLCETFLIISRIQWTVVVNVHKCSYKVPVVLVRLEISRQIFEKSSNIEFHVHLSLMTGLDTAYHTALYIAVHLENIMFFTFTSEY